MKVWDEEEVLQELVAARMAVAVDQSNTNNSSNPKKNKGNNKKLAAPYTDERPKLPFLLILVRKVQRKCYEFIYYPAETYERIDDVFQHTCIETDDAALNASGSEDEETVWIHGHASASSSDEEEEAPRPFEPYFVGKAIFHTASGETLLKIEGSLGWKEALIQNYHGLDAKAKSQVEQLLLSTSGPKNHTAVKAVASAAIGGGTIVGGTSLAAAGMGYTAGGITAGSYAATVMATEAMATGGGVAAGGFTATMQTIGAVGVLASPVGVGLAAAGAMGGLGTYLWMHRRNKAKQRKEEEEAQLKQLEEMARELAAADNEYQRLSEEDPSEMKEPDLERIELWVLVSAKRIEMEDSEHCFDHQAWKERMEADQSFLEVASTTTAKALFDPRGVLRRVDCDPADRDGWETALSLHYNYLVDQDLIPTSTALDQQHKDSAREDTPLLRKEEEE